MHSEKPAIGNCSICRRPVCELCGQLRQHGASSELRCPVCAELGVPWDRRAELGVVRAYLETVRGALFTPERTFKGLPAARDLKAPFVYDLITLYVGTSVPTLLTALTVAALPVSPIAGVTMAQASRFVLWSYPLSGVFVALCDLGLAGLIHGCLRFTGVGAGGFARTYASLVYGSSPALLNITVILPSLLIPQLWGTYGTIVALREAHRTTNFRATTAVVVPYGALTLIGGALFMLWLGDAYQSFSAGIPI